MTTAAAGDDVRTVDVAMACDSDGACDAVVRPGDDTAGLPKLKIRLSIRPRPPGG